MLKVHVFTFNPYQENTYLISDENNNSIIVDPGMSDYKENKVLFDYIKLHNLVPKILLNTHCHVDHVLGNNAIYEEYNLIAQFHEAEIPTLVSVTTYAPQMGFDYTPAPIPEFFLEEGDSIKLGKHTLKVIFAPGHSPAHLCFYSADYNFIIAGDVLFNNSIGRTDLPGGNHELLLKNIKEKLYVLPDNTIVYPGHGTTTTIGDEKVNNPFVRA